MKKGIHPNYAPTIYTCGCGAVHEINSVKGGNISVEICSNCHPVYTGKEKTIDSEGRIDRFKKKYSKK